MQTGKLRLGQATLHGSGTDHAGLDRVAAFARLSQEGRDRLARGVAIRRFPGSRTIVEKGQAVSGAYFVLEGRLRVYTCSADGKEALLYAIDPGETCILALNSLFNNLLYPAWVETESPTAVAIVPGEVYRYLFEREGSIRDLTVRALSTLVFRLMDELDRVHSLPLEGRLANLLLVRASADGVVRKTQQEIAADIGTSREVVGRLMADLAARGTVETGRGRVRIRDREELTQLARGGMEAG